MPFFVYPVSFTEPIRRRLYPTLCHASIHCHTQIGPVTTQHVANCMACFNAFITPTDSPSLIHTVARQSLAATTSVTKRKLQLLKNTTLPSEKLQDAQLAPLKINIHLEIEFPPHRKSFPLHQFVIDLCGQLQVSQPSDTLQKWHTILKHFCVGLTGFCRYALP